MAEAWVTASVFLRGSGLSGLKPRTAARGDQDGGSALSRLSFPRRQPGIRRLHLVWRLQGRAVLTQGLHTEHTSVCRPLEPWGRQAAVGAASHQRPNLPDGETEAPRGQTGPEVGR